MRQRILITAAVAFFGTADADRVCAAGPAVIDGATLGWIWTLPFAGILASLAVLPVVTPNFWHHRQGLVALFWSLAFLTPFAASFGLPAALREIVHVLLMEYIPFIALIGALFVIAGGIYVGGALGGSPSQNAALLLMGAVLASFVGTTGAAMIFVRPIIRANRDRKHKSHVLVFFTFLVCNIGGALTPLGDPPLFLGYLEGIDFFWPLRALWPHTLFVTVLVLGIFLFLDAYYFRKEGLDRELSTPHGGKVHVRGLVNVPLIVLLVAAVAASGSNGWGEVSIFGTDVAVISLARDIALFALASASLALTPLILREQNEFSWAPVLEVAKLFAAIFITIVPAIAILKAGSHGSFASLLALLGDADNPNNAAYFWLTGALSSFLDNAPTYLVFFNAAGGDAEKLMGPMARTLTALSAGAVFMGAMTYIGNAPNFMVKAIAEHNGIKMPSFFGFMVWSGLFLLPVFALLTFIFFR